jgi:hypothetical protein
LSKYKNEIAAEAKRKEEEKKKEEEKTNEEEKKKEEEEKTNEKEEIIAEEIKKKDNEVQVKIHSINVDDRDGINEQRLKIDQNDSQIDAPGKQRIADDDNSNRECIVNLSSMKVDLVVVCLDSEGASAMDVQAERSENEISKEASRVELPPLAKQSPRAAHTDAIHRNNEVAAKINDSGDSELENEISSRTLEKPNAEVEANIFSDEIKKSKQADLDAHNEIMLSTLSFLYNSYKPEFYYWFVLIELFRVIRDESWCIRETLEVIRRVILTGVLAVIQPGSNLQIVIGILIAELFKKIYSKYGDHI